MQLLGSMEPMGPMIRLVTGSDGSIGFAGSTGSYGMTKFNESLVLMGQLVRFNCSTGCNLKLGAT